MMPRASKELAVAKEFLRKINIVSTKGNDDEDKVSPASYWEVELRSFLIMLVANINTSVSWVEKK